MTHLLNLLRLVSLTTFFILNLHYFDTPIMANDECSDRSSNVGDQVEAAQLSRTETIRSQVQTFTPFHELVFSLCACPSS